MHVPQWNEEKPSWNLGWEDKVDITNLHLEQKAMKGELPPGFVPTH